MKVNKPSLQINNILPKVDNDDCYIDDTFTNYSDWRDSLTEQKELLKQYFDGLFKEKETYYENKILFLEQKVQSLQKDLNNFKKQQKKGKYQKTILGLIFLFISYWQILV